MIRWWVFSCHLHKIDKIDEKLQITWEKPYSWCATLCKMNWCNYTKLMRKLQITSQTACSCNSANPKSSQCGIPGHAVTLLIRKRANVESLVVEQNSCAFCKTPNQLHLSKPTVRESSLHSKSAWILWVLFHSIARQSILVQEPMRKLGQNYTNASIIDNSLFLWITMSPQCVPTLGWWACWWTET